MTPEEIDKLAWGEGQGLLPAVVQDAGTGQVLMLGYMNQEALCQTIQSERVTFFSRSRQSLWVKGETSGCFLDLVELCVDCDGDAILVKANPVGPTCHRGTQSCFEQGVAQGVGFLGYLDRFIEQRRRQQPEGSYTTKLFQAGPSRIAQKVGEEGVEVALAAKDEGTDGLRAEAADLLYHLIVLLRSRGLSLKEVTELLHQRHAP
jgi:phosphoribosyl-ATP pyrophosphohydrolase/phosphoribosyl-AMP cyclohydrolase